MKKRQMLTWAGPTDMAEEYGYPTLAPQRRHDRRRGRENGFAQQFYLLPHAQLRAAQRGLARSDIDYVLCHGWLCHTAEAEIYFLRGVDIPQQDQPAMSRLEGTAVIVARQRAQIITVWRNRQHGVRNIRRKLAQVWRAEELNWQDDQAWRTPNNAVA